MLALQAAAYKEVEAYPLDVLGAQTEGMIGYLIEQELGNVLPPDVPLATLLTMIEVDADDPAFADPTKFVGPIYDEAEGQSLAAEKGWTFKRDGDHLRRVVPSPAPETDLRDTSDPLVARPGCARHLRRRWRHPNDMGARAATNARGGRGRDRQGSGERVART